MVTGNGTYEGDCRIADGRIVELGELTAASDEKIIEASGLHLLPGIIDPQVHFREPGRTELENLESGSKAAASGGVTSFLDMPNNVPAVTTLSAMKDKLQSAASSCIVNHGFFIGASADNIEDLQECVGRPGEGKNISGICGIKIFMGSSTGDLLVDDEKVLERIFSETAGLIAVHAEDEDRLVQRFKLMKGRTDMAAHAEWRDSETALIATKLAVSMAQKHRRRLHVLHLSSALEADWLEGKTNLSINEDGAWITTETLPQYLTFDQHDIDVLGTRLKMNPPIRNDEDKDVLWRRIHDGTIQCIATDHAPHSLAAKSKGWPEAPSGMPGVETSLPVMLTHAVNGMCTIEDVVLWMSTNVTRIYGIDNKGVIAVGADADLVLVDMHNSMVVKDENAWTKVGWNPFIGRDLFGWPIMTLVSGTPVFERDLATDPKGSILVSPGQTGTALKMN